MQGSYCEACDFTYDGLHARCPECGGAVETLPDDPYVEVDTRERGSILGGVGLLLLLHLLQLVFVFDAPEALFFIGVTQAVYMIPAAIVLAVKGRTLSMGGVFIGAGVTFFANAAVVGLLCASMMDSGY